MMPSNGEMQVDVLVVHDTSAWLLVSVLQRCGRSP